MYASSFGCEFRKSHTVVVDCFDVLTFMVERIDDLLLQVTCCSYWRENFVCRFQHVVALITISYLNPNVVGSYVVFNNVLFLFEKCSSVEMAKDWLND